MKKKGFTLIELIVVIAIISVLMAILVPAMMGYLKKAKIQTANNNASEIVKTVNLILMEDEAADNFSNVKDDWYVMNSSSAHTALNEIAAGADKNLADYIQAYDKKIAKMTFAVKIKGGVAVAAATQSGAYYGTFPVFLSNRNYEKEMTEKSLDGAIKAAEKEYNTRAGITESNI